MLPINYLASLLMALLFYREVAAFCATQPSSSSSARPVITLLRVASEEKETTVTDRLNPLLSSIAPSATVMIFGRVKELQAQGVAVTSLCVGEPDFLPPPAVLQAVHDAVNAGDTKYTAVTGTAALRQAIADDLQRRKNVTYHPATDICVANGAKQAVYQGMLATVGVGDAVLIPAPYWPSYPEMARLCGAEPVIVSTTAADGYLLTPDALRNALQQNDRIQLLILCNPSNPTGAVYNQTQLEALAAVLADFSHVTILADEIYERLSYQGPVPAVASVASLYDRTLTVNGFSKAYAMTGLRLGYLAAPAPLATAVATLQSQISSCAGSLSQAAGVAALTAVADDELDANVAVMQAKRDYVWQALSDMPGVQLPAAPPAGAFYILADVAAYCQSSSSSSSSSNNGFADDVALCQALLETQRLAVVPGTAFGAPGTLRLSYATSRDALETAMAKLGRFLAEQRATRQLNL